MDAPPQDSPPAANSEFTCDVPPAQPPPSSTPVNTGASQPMPIADATYGFLTAVELPELGHCGGLLLLTENGRPIEFHCTTPVKPNRAQEILYGPTLDGFILRDQIGQSLFSKVRSRINLIITDQKEMLELAGSLGIPFILPADGGCAIDDSASQIALGQDVLIVENGSQTDLDWTKAACRKFTQTLPLDEPFERIRQAIDEAHAVASK